MTKKQNYARKNEHLSKKHFDKLSELFARASVAEVCELMYDLAPMQNKVYFGAKVGFVYLGDLEQECGRCYADSVTGIFFHGGPELANSPQFQMLQGSLLDWMLDHIFYHVTVEGPSLTYNRIGIEEDMLELEQEAPEQEQEIHD